MSTETKGKKMSLMSKLKKNSKNPDAEVLSKSQFFEVDIVPIDVPMMNVALSGDLDGGLSNGLTVLAGPSKHFKTSFALCMASSYMKHKPDSVLLFFDTEFGSPQAYFQQFNIDTDRVFHNPIKNIEELKFELINQLEQIAKEDDVIIIVDSIGNSASIKELEDALSEKSVADMTRAKALKGLFRMVTPYLAMKNIPMLAINHTYKEIGLFPKDIVSGGTGVYYSADNVWIVGRRQNKEGTEVVGYDFVIKVDKSRFLRENSKIPITVSFDGGIEKYSGLRELALAGGFIVNPTKGWFQKVDTTTGEIIEKKIRKKDLDTAEFWDDILELEAFKDFVRGTYMLTGKPTGVDVVPDEEVVQ